jgi:hypothetical protein
LNGSLSDINEHIKQISEQGNLQRVKTQTAQEISRTAQMQQTQANDYQVIDQGPMKGVPVGDLDLTKSVRWGVN